MATYLAPELANVDDAGPPICALPELRPQFFIPRLEEKPQNPIMDTLRFWQHRSQLQDDFMAQTRVLPQELRLLSEDVLKFEQAKRDQLESIWSQAVSRRHGSMVRRPMYARHTSLMRGRIYDRIKCCPGTLSGHPSMSMPRLRPFFLNSPARLLHRRDTSEYGMVW